MHTVKTQPCPLHQWSSEWINWIVLFSNLSLLTGEAVCQSKMNSNGPMSRPVTDGASRLARALNYRSSKEAPKSAISASISQQTLGPEMLQSQQSSNLGSNVESANMNVSAENEAQKLDSSSEEVSNVPRPTVVTSSTAADNRTQSFWIRVWIVRQGLMISHAFTWEFKVNRLVFKLRKLVQIADNVSGGQACWHYMHP